jgi:hypothetical protein
VTTRASSSQQQTVERLLAEHGTTYAEDAGITLRDEPSPLYQLLVLTTLASTRISAGIAVAAARELFAAGWRTPERMRSAARRERVAALGRVGYRRYDESTATTLGESATLLLEELHGDLRRLRPDGPDGVDDLLQALTDFPRIGPVGASIFVREVQDVWPVGPYFDQRSLRGAERLGLPTEPRRLAELAAGAADGSVARLAASLVKA